MQLLVAWAHMLNSVIDTHCHLTFPDFAGQTAQELEEAQRHGVTGAITVSTTSADCLDALALARRFENLWCTSGVHPLHAARGPHQWENLLAVAHDERCVAWGEMGLDRHYPDPPRGVQIDVLRWQLGMIEEADKGDAAPGKPIVLHCREAFAQLIPILGESRIEPARFVFHCFTGDSTDMRLVLDFGAMVSFTGVATYRNAEGVREAACLAPLDRLMVETDAPYLPPEPHRSKRPCRPWMASLTARSLAEARAEDWDRFHDAINQNTRRFYGIPC